MILFPDFHARYGPWAVIAGASEGIGLAYANALGERGINLLMLARRSEPLERQAAILRRRHRIEVRTAALDLAAADLATQFDALVADIDVGLLIYNACYSIVKGFLDLPLSDHLATIEVNCRGPVILSRLLAPRLAQRGRGGILLMSSMSGFQGSALVATYAATKAFDTNLAESLWAELGPLGVDVLAVVAGATSTPNFQASTPADKQGKAFPMRPEAVAREGIKALENARDKGPVHITGRINRLVNVATSLMSRAGRSRFFSNATRDIYQEAVRER